jgi:hypothetical protein
MAARTMHHGIRLAGETIARTRASTLLQRAVIYPADIGGRLSVTLISAVLLLNRHVDHYHRPCRLPTMLHSLVEVPQHSRDKSIFLALAVVLIRGMSRIFRDQNSSFEGVFLRSPKIQQ